MDELHPLIESEWKVQSLIGRIAERDMFTIMLRDSVPSKHGRIVLLTGAEGSGRTALARYGGLVCQDTRIAIFR